MRADPNTAPNDWEIFVRYPEVYTFQKSPNGVFTWDGYNFFGSGTSPSYCDTALSLLAGNSTSHGVLRDIAQEVTTKGPDYMPGSCCLDNPYTSEFAGYEVSKRL